MANMGSPKRELSYSQNVLRDLFADKNQIWNNGSNKIQINKTLSTGNGIIKSGDNGKTARMFGGF